MPFHTHTLPNGLTLLGETIPTSQSVAVNFTVRTGARDEQSSESGVSHFLEHMLFKGTPTRDALQLNLAFDRIGASDHTNASTGEESTEYYTAVLPEYLPQALDVLTDMLRPSLREADFTTEKQVILEEIEMYEDNPSAMAFDFAKETYYGRHPLGNSVLGTKESIRDLSVDQMRGYFARRYVAPNTIAIAAGNFDWPEFVGRVESMCAGWPGSPAPRELAPPAPNKGGLHCKTRADSTQQHVMVLMPASPANSMGRYAATVLALALGDYSGSRLYWQLVDPGKVESASFIVDAGQGSGVAGATFSCDPEQAVENLAAVQKLLGEVQAQGITEAELESARTKIASRLVRYAERPSGRMRAIAAAWLANGEEADVDRELGRYDAVTLSSVREYLEQYPLTANTVIGYGPLETLA